VLHAPARSGGVDSVFGVGEGQRVADVVALLSRRCAWCHRVFTADGWIAVESAETRLEEHEADTLCPDCVRLQLQGA
jgi:hypothetical protein